MLRIPTPLSEDLEELIHRTIGCCIAVHRALGPGLLESIYSRAVCLELGACRIPYEREKQIPVSYRGQLLCHQRIDLVIDNRLVLEIKSVEMLTGVHRAQLLCYLGISGLQVGLLANFNVPIMQDGVKRVIL
jgi:GxxExxY protein